MQDKEIHAIATALSKFEPGYLPYPIFEQVARIAALPVVEFIPLRIVNGTVEVLLLDRGPDDPIWPNMLHTPGTIVRATDFNGESRTVWPAFGRILHDELNDSLLGQPQFIGSILHKSKRGVEQAQLYSVEVFGEPKAGRFYSTTELPESLIESQLIFITEAAKKFNSITSANIHQV